MKALTKRSGEAGDNADIYVKLIGAGDPIRLTRNRADDISPTFAPDGKTIAFIRIVPTHSEVFSIPALGSAERKICDLRRTTSTISFSPDVVSLAVHDGDDGGRAGIFLVNISTGEKKRLTSQPELTADDRPAFASDSQTVAFIRSFAQSVIVSLLFLRILFFFDISVELTD